ncbi:septum formation family protein [Nocardioides rubriscoriae]|uniref:septum formation family protein n=1 Tax=Nocardioides rubriscoriae TaxID=642762 RepID=UPI0014793E19|nr:septum formation family protein [Nocardioides rubriscoriae]
MKTSPLRALGGAVLVAALAGALLNPPAASYAAGATVQARATADKPAVGSCHALTLAEAAKATDPDPVVDCATSHTSRTFAVPSVPDGVDMGDNDALSKVVTRKCVPAYATAVSTNIKKRLLSAYFYVWFAPTQQQIDAGARWVRCDLALSGGKSLVPLPEAKTPALGTTPFPDVEARCYTGRAGGFRPLSCSRAHRFRARSVYSMTGRAYPSQAKRQRVAERRCRPVAGQRWTVFGPSQEQWKAGFKYFVCTTATRR